MWKLCNEIFARMCVCVIWFTCVSFNENFKVATSRWLLHESFVVVVVIFMVVFCLSVGARFIYMWFFIYSVRSNVMYVNSLKILDTQVEREKKINDIHKYKRFEKQQQQQQHCSSLNITHQTDAYIHIYTCWVIDTRCEALMRFSQCDFSLSEILY